MYFSTYVRIKPLKDEAKTDLIKIKENEIYLMKSVTTKNRTQKYNFDRIFSENANQSDLFENCGREIIDETLKGKNGALMVYGETGSGKTHTMLGSSYLISEMGRKRYRSSYYRISFQFEIRNFGRNGDFFYFFGNL